MALELEGEEVIPASKQIVWAALNDIAMLQACIPGCESLEREDETHLNAVVSLKIGPVKAKFKGAVELQNLNPPDSYTISGEGSGGIAGFAKGGADVTLEETGHRETTLRYVAKADVGGKIAQLGSRLIKSTSNKLAKQFFSNLNQRISQQQDTPTA